MWSGRSGSSLASSDIPITIHVSMGRLAGRFAMVKTLDDYGLLGPDTTYIHCCHFSDEEWQLVKDSGGKISVAPQVESPMGHGWPPLLQSLRMGLRPSLSIDVVTTAPGDMFTQMRAGVRVPTAPGFNAEKLRAERAGTQGRADRARRYLRWQPSTARTSPGSRTAPAR